MSSSRIEIQLDPRFRDEVHPETLRRLVLRTLDREAAPNNARLTIVITDDGTLRELNKRYREIDAVTDVLCFPTRGGDAGFPTLPAEEGYLGEVIASYPRAVAQAEERGHSPTREIGLLVVHGVLHLLGYEDKTEEGRARMWRRQEELLWEMAPAE